jgi:FkbM family methyltransferase
MHQVDLIIDIGANRGQFSTEIFDAGYSGKIVSFEPVPKAHQRLGETAKKSRKSWLVAPRMALSDHSGSSEFYITDVDTSSSLLQPTDDFVKTLSQVKVVESIEVKTERLDDVVDKFISEEKSIFLKLDVQGNEHSVLRGAGETLSRCQGVLVEVCIDSLYSDQSKLDDILNLISEAGFGLWDINTAYRNPDTLRIGAIDVLGFRERTSGGER